MKILLPLFMLVFFGISAFGQSGSEKQGITGNRADNPIQMNISTDLSIFPNPVKEKQFCIESSGKKIAETRIYSITGKEIFMKKIDSPVLKAQIALPEIPDGIYLVSVRFSDLEFKTVKIIVRSN